MMSECCKAAVCEVVQDPAPCFAIRQEVFCDEQGFVEEFDEHDNHPNTVHVVLRYHQQPAGCARYLIACDDAGVSYVRAGRIAIRAQLRGKGLGKVLMEQSLRQALHALNKRCPHQMRGIHEVRLHSQADKVGFYESCGFVVMEVAPDEEEGVPHQWMHRIIL